MLFYNFNPDDTGVANGNYFGFPCSEQESELILLSVPWDVTVSYNEGTSGAPSSIVEASIQVEIFDSVNPDGWRRGIATAPVDEWVEEHNGSMRKLARAVIEHIENGGASSDPEISAQLQAVNVASQELNDRVYRAALSRIAMGKRVALVGGDHSTPLGLIRAVAQSHESIGILHIDAHCDLRDAYEGFVYSHASIMYNALKCKGVDRLVQVAVRDFSKPELELAAGDPRVVQFTDMALAKGEFEGKTWSVQCAEIVESLPQKVYISFDIDGLSPDNCPSTGTPVPGGLSYRQAMYLICSVVESGRRVVGFDLTEVSPSMDESQQWDANVGARILYKLCNLALID